MMGPLAPRLGGGGPSPAGPIESAPMAEGRNAPGGTRPKGGIFGLKKQQIISK